MNFEKKIDNYLEAYFEYIKTAEFSIRDDSTVIHSWYEEAIKELLSLNKREQNLFLIGNGASCSMASHLATDFTKNAGLNAFSLSEGTLLTTFSNDFSYETAYMELLKRYMKDGDALIAISSSGKSKNVLNAVSYVRDNLKKSTIISYSGFRRDNPLRSTGDFNLYVSCEDYGIVESAHAFFLHILIDLFIEKKNTV